MTAPADGWLRAKSSDSGPAPLLNRVQYGRAVKKLLRNGAISISPPGLLHPSRAAMKPNLYNEICHSTASPLCASADWAPSWSARHT